jgi:hypothetical protein
MHALTSVLTASLGHAQTVREAWKRAPHTQQMGVQRMAMAGSAAKKPDSKCCRSDARGIVPRALRTSATWRIALDAEMIRPDRIFLDSAADALSHNLPWPPSLCTKLGAFSLLLLL